MNITTNYHLNSFYLRANNQLQTNPSFGMTKKIVEKGAEMLIPAATVAAGTILAIQNGKASTKTKEYQTEDYGKLEYTKGRYGEKSSLNAIRKNGTVVKLFDGIPKEKLESPVMEHVHQANCSTISPNVGIVLMQNKSDKPVMSRKIPLQGTLEENMVNANINNIPLKFDNAADTQMINAPWSDQQITQKSFMVKYGTVDKDSWALDSYLNEYADENGKAPDVAVLAAEKGAEDRSVVPANIALGQYEIVLENGERIPCDYEKMEVGKVYMIAKKEAVLKMAVPYEDVISSEGEVLKAGKLYMVDSMGHFYNGQPIKRIKSGEVSWNADMNDPVQANIRNLIDESLRLEKEAKPINKEAGEFEKQAKELKEQNSEEADKLAAKASELKAQANALNAQAKEFHAKAEQAMTEWVKSAQNPEGVNFFAE